MSDFTNFIDRRIRDACRSDAMIADVKRLGPGDGHVLHNVADDVFDDELVPAHIESFLKEQNHILIVACLDGCVIGQLTAMLHRHLDSAGEVYIDNLGVAPQHQRRGVATRLIAQLLEIGRELGCRSVWVATDMDNAAAAALYRRTGAIGATASVFSYDLREVRK